MGSTAMRRVRVPVLLAGLCLLAVASASSREDSNMDAAVAESRHDERSLDATSFSGGSDGAGRSAASKVCMCVRVGV